MLQIVIFPVVIALLSSFNSVQAQWIQRCPRAVSWSLPDPASTNKSCILMTGNYYLFVPYTKQDGRSGTAKILIPDDSAISGSCGGAKMLEQSITLTWPVVTDNNISTAAVVPKPTNNEVTFTFTKNSTSGSIDEVDGYFCLQKLKAVLHSNPDDFPGTTEPAKMYTLQAENMGILSSPLNTSYFCSSLQEYPIGEGVLRLEHIQIESFHKEPLLNDGLDFSPRAYCLPDELRMLITAIVLIILLVATGGFVLYLCLRSRKSPEYGRID